MMTTGWILPWTLICVQFGHSWERLEEDEPLVNAECSWCGALGIVDWKPDPTLQHEHE